MPYVTERWLGGMLTNLSTMYARIQELDRLEQLRDSGEINRLTQTEGLMLQREIDRLLIRLSGVRLMRKLPDLLFVVDVGREDAAVHEANLLKIPVVALVDTNCSPQGIDYVVPSNDDAIRAIKLLVAKVADAVLEGKAMRKDEEPEEAGAMAAEGGAEQARMHKAVKMVESDEEQEEGALLGAATLAKLSASRQPEEVVAVAVPEIPAVPEATVMPDAPANPAAPEDEPLAGPAAADESPSQAGMSEPEAGSDQKPAVSE